MLRRSPYIMSILSAVLVANLGGCGDSSDTAPITDSGPPDSSEEDPNCPTLNFAPGDETALQDAVNSIAGCTKIVLSGGKFVLNNAITIRTNDVTISGAGQGERGDGDGSDTVTILDFTDAAPNTNGLDVVGNHFTVQDLTVWNAKKDGIRIESSSDVKIQRVRTEWANEDDPDNGAYGIYPVSSQDVLVEDCEAYKASDAGIYVGQTIRAIVRRNIAAQNVAGIEIENTQYADVYGNTAEDNTAGLVVFDLPGNPVKGTDISVHDNQVRNNNRPNFASVSAASSTVSQIPAGTGTFIMASRRVELTGNTYENNNNVDVAVLSGFIIEDDIGLWAPGGFNYGTSDIFIHNNTFLGGSGDSPDNGNVDPNLRPIGWLVKTLYDAGAMAGGSGVTEAIVWDGIDDTLADDLVNNIGLCVENNTLSDPNLPVIGDINVLGVLPLLDTDTPDPAAAWAKTARYKHGEAPFNCGAFEPALAPVTLP